MANSKEEQAGAPASAWTVLRTALATRGRVKKTAYGVMIYLNDQEFSTLREAMESAPHPFMDSTDSRKEISHEASS